MAFQVSFADTRWTTAVAICDHAVTTIYLASRRRKLATIEKSYPGAAIIDVTSKADEPWVRFSPFYPHGGIPVPNSPGITAQSVEGVWQGLKVFESGGIDTSSCLFFGDR